MKITLNEDVETTEKILNLRELEAFIETSKKYLEKIKRIEDDAYEMTSRYSKDLDYAEQNEPVDSDYDFEGAYAEYESMMKDYDDIVWLREIFENNLKYLNKVYDEFEGIAVDWNEMCERFPGGIEKIEG